MANITVVGAGMMGTALTFPAADNGHTVHLVGTHLDTDIIESCQQQRIHPTLKRHIPDSVKPFFHTQVAEAIDSADVVVLGVNSRGVHWIAETLGPHLKPGQITLMVTKGLEADDELQILPDVFAAGLPNSIRDQIHYAAIGGPSIAGELAARRHTSVIFTSRDADIVEKLRGWFVTPYYHIWTSTDMIGVELAVALKNPYALAVGLVAGVLESQEQDAPDEAGARMYNMAAALFAQGLAEIAYLVQKLGGGIETVYSLPGAGDLYVTSMGGRNARMGRLLGMGVPYSSAVEEMPETTIEGVDAVVAIVPAIERMIAQGRLDADAMPLLRKMYAIVTQSEAADFDYDSFFANLPFNPPPRD